jgi:hypothetical protein
MTGIEILDNTVEYYSNNNRCRIKHTVNGNGCCYNDGDGNHCAVGRWLRSDLQAQGLGLEGNYSSVDELVERTEGAGCLDDLLIEGARGIPSHAWGHIQSLHDGDEFWSQYTDADGLIKLKLTSEGEHKAEWIKGMIS